jgi:aspartate aminotransferase/aminotransferase
MRAVAELARKHDLTIIADDIYDTLIFDAPHVAMGRLYDRTLTVGGWGKSLSITGWRIGFAAGPADIVQQMIKMQMYTFVCVPGPAQKAVADCRELWPAEEAARIYREKRNYLCDRLATKYRFERPGGTFYLFPEAPGGSGSAFCERAIEQGLLVIPGIGFSRRDSHFRISFAVADDRLEQAASLLLKLAG